LHFSVGANYPNPFNPTTIIPIEVPSKTEATLAVYSLLGQRIAVLHEGSLDAGRHWFQWDGKDQSGYAASSGVYLYRLTTHTGISITRKMVLIH
jgi:flagellar hook assembly protein FlgD